MISIRIQCECGQRYAFDAEPVDGRVTGNVACPACGADGTAAANAAIAQGSAAQTAPAAQSRSPLRVEIPASPARQTTSSQARMAAQIGQVDRAQAEHEARAKMTWGDRPREVIAYLMVQGYTQDEATFLVQELRKERLATIRGNGIKKTLMGSGLICVPIVAFFIFLGLGYIYVKTFIVTILIGLWGIWVVISGVSMVLSPKKHKGDVNEQ